MDDALVAQAAAEGAPRLTRAAAAHVLQADPERLAAALEGHATDTDAAATGTGLREDQAAAALSVLTDGRRVSVINAPAGAGKTRVLAEVAKAWAAAGLGPVVGITASQSARNTLAAGVTKSYNSAQFLGHLPGKRGARGPVPVAPGTLLVIDEASMMTGPDLADLITLAEKHGGKVIVAGDTSAAAGGAERRRHVPARRPPRLRPPRPARPVPRRLGTGRHPAAARRRRHRARRVRPARPDYRREPRADDGRRSRHLHHPVHRRDGRAAYGRRSHPAPGVVAPYPRRPAPPRPGQQRLRGDNRRRHHRQHRRPDRQPQQRPQVEAGEPGRTLANGDLLRIDAITPDGLLVRRALDADPKTGQRRWTDRQFLYADYKDAELGYAVTDHAAQGRTVHTGLAVFTGTEDRQHAYVALTRGTTNNSAYVFTVSPKRADPAPGPRPAPELARYDRLAAQTGERGAAAPTEGRSEPDAQPDPLGVLAEILDRDSQALSASQTWRQALADADHLAVLNATWTAETAPARDQRYRDLLTGSAPAGVPARTQPPREVAVEDPARRRTGRPGRPPGACRSRRPAGPGRNPTTSPP